MNFGQLALDPSQEAFEAEARRVLEDHWTPDPHIIALDHDRPTPELVEVLAERGWVHPRTSPEDGGAGLGAVEARVLTALYDEYRVPNYNNDLILPTLRKHGSEELRATVLPDLASGRKSFCLGYSEPDSGSDMAAARTRAVQDGDTWVINGSKMFTTYAHESDYVFMLARTGPVEDKHRTLTMFLVPMDSEGVEVQPIWAMGRVRTNMSYYRDVRIPDTYRLGPVNEGWRVVSEPLAAEHGRGDFDALEDLNGSMGAAFTRTLERLVQCTVDWAARTRGADGRPLIEDPVVRQQLATALLDIEVCWNTPGEFGKVMAAETLIRHADALADLTAPAGILAEGAEGAIAHGLIGWARLFAPGTAIYGGTTEIYRNNLARGALGLPRSR
jgi:alkylation response protein AidB-like acyl-CoA dehydrogenase